MKILEIKNLTLDKNNSKILDINQLTIEKGEYVTLLGQNGSGKSTLANLIVGIEEDYNGELNTYSKGIGMVFENPDNQIVASTVEEDIAFGLQNKMMSREEMHKVIDETLSRMGILDLKKRNVQTLSGGQKQKVALAALIALDFDTYIFDEVTSMLDPDSKKIIRESINELVKEGKTIIEITHFPEEMILSNRSVIINDGKIVYDGSTKELFKNNKKLLEENRLIE